MNELTVTIPCRIGDEAWGIKPLSNGKSTVCKGVITGIYFDNDMHLCAAMKGQCKGEIGKKVFFTMMDAARAIPEDASRFALYDKGHTDAEIAKAEGITKEAARAWRKKLGLAPNGTDACDKNGKSLEPTICWRCKHTSLAECPWFNPKNPQPVEGWEAERTKIKVGRNLWADSFRVISCPNFELDTDCCEDEDTECDEV